MAKITYKYFTSIGWCDGSEIVEDSLAAERIKVLSKITNEYGKKKYKEIRTTNA